MQNAPYLWHKGPDFVKDGVPVPLLLRMATIQDRKPAEGRIRTRRLWHLPADQARACACARSTCTIPLLIAIKHGGCMRACA